MKLLRKFLNLRLSRSFGTRPALRERHYDPDGYRGKQSQLAGRKQVGKFLRVICIICVTALLLAAPCCCKRDPAESLKAYPDLVQPQNDIAGLSNFAKLSDNVWRGAQPEEEGFIQLKKMGVKTVINLRNFHSDKDDIAGLGLQYVEIPLNAGDTDEANVVKFLKAVTNSDNLPVFFHCQHGSDRTGMMAAIYRIYVEGWDKEKAIAELPVFGFHEIYDDIRDYINKLDIESLRKKVEAAPPIKAKIIP
ncbi:MAG: tyrosine-protein phosphatase [Planctomycetes bacterium]|nr:tyrosine-protein phosphatase [Planctomycetota bacterium]